MNELSSTDALAASQRQFGANAANYATSEVHAKGASLAKLVEMAEPQPDWVTLDIATAAGHTAFAFAPHVSSVVASDATPEMLDVARGVAQERGIENVTFEFADAQDLGFDNDSFDLVTCRIAPHHFAEPDRFVAEVARVLRPGGTFGLVDNVAPPNPDTAKWCDDWERRRDPSHVRYLPVGEWLELFEDNDFETVKVETIGKAMTFQLWADNMSVEPDTRAELLNDLATAPAGVADWLRPDVGDPASFVLTEGIFIATGGY